MIQEDNKDLLLKYLCMSLPYNVKVKDKELTLGIEHINVYNEVCLEYPYNTYTVDIEEVKPYLRLMSDMTEEEMKEYKHLIAFSGSPQGSLELLRWRYKKHFNISLPKDMFIEVTKYNNPYKDDL